MISECDLPKYSNNYQKSKLPFAVLRPSRGIEALQKLYDLALMVLFFTIAVVALLVGIVVEAVLPSTPKQSERLVGLAE